MRFLIATNTPNTWTGGAARVMYFLRESLARLGHETDLVFQEDVAFPFSEGARWKRTLFPLLLPLKIRELWRGKGRHDVVVIQTREAAAYVLLRKLFRRLPPCVVLSYGADELSWERELEEERLGFRRLGMRARLFYYNLVIRRVRYALRHAGHAVTAVRAEKKFYEEAYGRSSDSVTVIPFGVSGDFFTERDYRRPARSLLFVGGWEWRKGIRYLAEAFARIAAVDPNVELTVAATLQEGVEVRKMFPADLHGRIRVIPRVEPDRMPALYAEHDVFLFPSLFEGMPLVLLEAMASGMPVVTTRTCGMEDLVEDGVSGFLIPMRDADSLAQRVRLLLEDAALRERLGLAARERARAMTWDRMAVTLAETCAKLAGPSPVGKSES